MGKVIAFTNEKGGVAKTTTVKNLSVGLANAGKKVLVIDLDPSANLTTALGVFPEDNSPSILNILRMSDEFEDIPNGFAIIHHDEGMDFIPGTASLHLYEKILSQTDMAETLLRRYINDIKNNYDYVLIDCQAGLGFYVTNALYAADAILIPVQPQFLGVGAMQNLFAQVNKVRKLNGTGRKPEILGVLFTMVRANTTNDREMMKYYREKYDSKIYMFDTYIPLSARFTESDGEGKSIFAYAPKTSAALIYGDLVEEFLNKESMSE